MTVGKNIHANHSHNNTVLHPKVLVLF